MNKNNITKSLKKLKFEEDNRHHKFFETSFQGFQIKTKISHGSNEAIGKRLFSKISKDIFLKPIFFEEVCKCTYNRKDYDEKLKQVIQEKLFNQ